MYLWCLRPYTRQCVIREMIRNGVEAHTNRKTQSAVTGVAGVPEGRGRMQEGDPYLGREGTGQGGVPYSCRTSRSCPKLVSRRPGAGMTGQGSSTAEMPKEDRQPRTKASAHHEGSHKCRDICAPWGNLPCLSTEPFWGQQTTACFRK